MPHPILTDRQAETLRILCTGKTVRETADLLGVALPTVMMHFQAIRRRLNTRELAELCRMMADDKPAPLR